MRANDPVKDDIDELGADARAPIGLTPRDALEAEMLASLRAAHAAAMACYRDAAHSGDDAARRESLSQAIRLTRAFAMVLDALLRRRARPDRGASCGRRGGVAQESAEQPHAQAVASALPGAAIVPPPSAREANANSTEQPHARAFAPVPGAAIVTSPLRSAREANANSTEQPHATGAAPVGSPPRAKTKEQPHAPAVVSPVSPALWRPHPSRRGMPGACHAQWPVPPPRRAVAGRAERQPPRPQARASWRRGDRTAA